MSETSISLEYPKGKIPDQLQLYITPKKISIRSFGQAVLGRGKEVNLKTITEGNKKNQIFTFKTYSTNRGIRLPMPSSFTTNLTHNWNESKSFYTNVWDNIRNLIAQKVKDIGGLQTFLSAEGLTGYEPKIAHYESTNPLEFTFEWKFTPKSEDEAKKIYQITKVFQIGSMPQGEAGKTGILKLVRAPYLWMLQFIPNVKTSRIANQRTVKNYYFLKNKLDDMILASVNTNYTPDGDFYPFMDGSPTSLNLSLTFRMSRNIMDYAKVFGTLNQIESPFGKIKEVLGK